MEAAAIVRELMTPEGQRDLYSHYRALHELGPVLPLGDQTVVVGHDAVGQVLRNRSLHVRDRDKLDLLWPTWRDHPLAVLHSAAMIFDSGPGHDRVRRLIGKVFTARRVAGLEPVVRERASALLERMATLSEPVDFVAEFAYKLPSTIVGALLGVSDEEGTWLRQRSELTSVFIEPDVAHRDVAAADVAAVELDDFVGELVGKRRACPGDDLVSELVHVRDSEDGRLSETELRANITLLLVAGYQTTTHMLGTGLALLTERPGDHDLLRADDPAVVSAWVEELLRYDSPVQATLRWTPHDLTLAGVRIPAGGRILVLVGAANHDPARFPDPDRFDPARPDNNQFAFGTGPYHCLAAALARLEARVAFPMILNRFPRIRPAGEPAHRQQLVLRGADDMPVWLT